MGCDQARLAPGPRSGHSRWMAAGNPWTIEEGGGPVVACAIHAGSDVRAEVLRHMAVRRRQRVYEGLAPDEQEQAERLLRHLTDLLGEL